MIGISTHVLDTARGRPAQGIRVELEQQAGGGLWIPQNREVTDGNGRIAQLLPKDEPLEAGRYKLTFFVGDYFEKQDHFYWEIAIQFVVRDPLTHYHIPLLLSPYGYSTYRGS